MIEPIIKHTIDTDDDITESVTDQQVYAMLNIEVDSDVKNSVSNRNRAVIEFDFCAQGVDEFVAKSSRRKSRRIFTKN